MDNCLNPGRALALGTREQLHDWRVHTHPARPRRDRRTGQDHSRPTLDKLLGELMKPKMVIAVVLIALFIAGALLTVEAGPETGFRQASLRPAV